MKNKPFAPEIKAQAIEMLLESQKQKEHPTLWAAICHIAPKYGCTPETLRKWHQNHLAKQNPIIVTAQSQTARISELEREVKQLKQINEILKKATAFFAQTELDRSHK